MSAFIAALPMYDWPETRATVDAQWAGLRDRLRAKGIDAPDALVRRNGDMPEVSGGIRDEQGREIAPDPAVLAPDELDFPTLWRHPRLLFAQTCWGPMEITDLAEHVTVIGQPDYSDVEGGKGALYSSAIVMRRGHASPGCVVGDVSPPADGSPEIPVDLLRGKRLAFNSHDSMSGLLGITRDLGKLGETGAFWSQVLETAGHRMSIRAVAEGAADAAAVDCRSWAMAQRFEPATAKLQIVGWTALRKGLPFISARAMPESIVAELRAALRTTAMTTER